MRAASKSKKAKEASRRNLEAGGYNRKASEIDLVRVYLKKTEWTWQDFVAAVEKKIGTVYSRAQAFTLLKKFKTLRPAIVSVDGKSHVAYAGTPIFLPARKPANAVARGDGGLEPAVTLPVLSKEEAAKIERDDANARAAVARGKKAAGQR